MEILTKCGYRCDLCLAYKSNVEKNDQRDILSDGWKSLYGFRIKPNDIVCEGCVSCDNPDLIDKACPVRLCVIDKEIENCAFCDEYICEKLKKRIVNRDHIEKRLNRKLTEKEYKLFVKPYESKERLDNIKASLK